MIRFFYNLLYPVAFLFLLPGYLSRMLRRGNYRHRFGQRFGIYSERVKRRFREAGGPWIWVHAVSVGEVLIAQKFIEELLRRDASTRIALTTTTTTGTETARAFATERMELLYTPIDFFVTARAAVDMVRPKALVLIEAEVWPNLVAEVRKRGGPVLLANARMSPRSFRRFFRFRHLAAPLFNQIDAIGLQMEQDRELWDRLGVDRPRLEVTGSIKLDAPEQRAPGRDFRPVLERLGIRADQPVLLAGSTHPGEEEVLLAVVRQLRVDFPDVVLLLVPRHFERGAALAAMLAEQGEPFVQRSCGFPPTPPAEPPRTLLIDTTGELRDWYFTATVAFIGKSLVGKGGQNPAEAIEAGCPVLFGPQMQNFAALTRQLLDAEGAVQVPDEKALTAAVADLLQSREKRERLVANGRGVLATHRGAAARSVDLLLDLLRTRGNRGPAPSSEPPVAS